MVGVDVSTFRCVWYGFFKYTRFLEESVLLKVLLMSLLPFPFHCSSLRSSSSSFDLCRPTQLQPFGSALLLLHHHRSASRNTALLVVELQLLLNLLTYFSVHSDANFRRTKLNF